MTSEQVSYLYNHYRLLSFFQRALANYSYKPITLPRIDNGKEILRVITNH